MSRTDDRPSSPPLPWQRLTLVSHIVLAVSVIGAALVLVALGVAGLRGAEPRTIYPAAHLVEAWVVAPLAVLALASGLVQAVVTRRGLLAHRWITVKLVTTAGLATVVLLALEPRLAASAQRATSGQPIASSDFLPLTIAPGVAVVLLVLNVALGVTKPALRR